MKQLLVLLMSMGLFACGGGDSGGSAGDAAESAADVAEEAAKGAMDDAAEAADDAVDAAEGAIEEATGAMHDAMDDAEAVEDMLMEKKEEVDAAIEEATSD